MPEGTKIGTLYIDLELNKAPYKQGLTQTSAELNNFKRSAASAFSGGLDQGTRKWSISLADANRQLFYLAGGANAVVGAFKLVGGTAKELANIGLGAQRSELAFDKLSGSAKEADKWINAIRKSTLNTVTEGEAAAQAYNLMAFGLAKSADEAGRFSRDMAIIAAARPQLGGVENAIAQIQLTLANTSFMRLDQLGLSTAKVKDRMAELQAQTAGLSREQAFNQAVMEGLHTQADILGDDFLAVGSNMAALDTLARQFKENVGGRIAEGFEGAAKAGLALIEIWKYFDEHPFKVGGKEIGGPSDIVRAPVDYLLAYTHPGVDEKKLAEETGLARRLRNERLLRESQAAPPTLPPALMQYYGSMAQRYAGYHGPVETPEYYSQWAPGTATQYGTGRAPRSALASLQAPGFMGQQTRIAGAFGLSEMQQQMEWIEKGQGGDIVAQFFGAIETGARGATAQIQAGTGALQGMVQTAESISFDSLEEKFGIDPSTFNLDVYSEMQNALSGAGVEADLAADAMSRYELQTGIATGSSEIFAGQMDTLAQQLAEGKISAEEYVDSVTKLSQADYSWVDRLIQPLIDQGDLDMAQQYIDIVQQMATQSWTASGVQTAELGMGAEMGIGEGGGGVPGGVPEAAAGPFAPIIDGSIEATRALGDLETEGGGHVTTLVNLATGQFAGWRDNSIADIQNVRDAFMALDGLHVNLGTTVGGSGGAAEPTTHAGGGGIPEYAEGGPVTARGMVDVGEYVVPEGGALVMKGGGGGTIVNQVYVAGRVVYEETQREDQRRNRGQRVRDYRR